MKFSVALSFIAAAALAGSVSGSLMKREQANVESLKGAAACLAAKPSQQQQLTTAIPNAGAAAVDVVTEIVTVTAAGSENDGGENQDAPDVTGGESDGTSAAEGAMLEDITAEGAIPVDSAAAGDNTGAAADSTAQQGESPEAAPLTGAASPSAAATVSSSAPTGGATSSPQADTQASSSASGSSDGESSSGGNSETFSGDGTYFSPGLGSCGQTNTDEDLIAAINAPQYGATSGDPNSASVCGKCALVKGAKGQVKVTITDKCPPCKHGDLDLSPAAFKQIGNTDDGRIPITWSFVDC
ncbi:hypothetical protein IW140_003082 [Coemansia sp. RSA 1813]|nr:hypothetical protein EV178_002991 [Coemansia sp. RSA 1646]KAJ1767177.1 hypothetical protein LPJ74_005509 [Coemansia sp. RSA 1843]KAJ2089532.1 hypothetical protein IW138_003421 [Coemansia sp. RSA 986]KAJ2214497.1 hypothetical protein EV179_002902 [Coemansia sp. RSA 487]KAJ2569379.1 hypothetical protein IW140_003082 [Coemansia sp. RSA 1813]